MKQRILYIATADARGHLMRCQLLAKQLQARGIAVDILTTSSQGIDFLAAFGLKARLFATEYYVEFDKQHNVDRRKTDWRITKYQLSPKGLLKDMRFLARQLPHYTLIINDSFQPAALALPVFSRQARQKMLLVFGDNLRTTVLNHLNNRWPAPLATFYRWATRKQINQSRACLVHSFSFQQHTQSSDQHEVYLPTPVTPFNTTAMSNHNAQKQAVIYLNPHFQCAEKAQTGVIKSMGLC